MRRGCPYGTHRVLEPKGLLPQPAWKIDNTMELYDNEVLIEVDALNIDSASFTQIKQEAGEDDARIGEIMMKIVADRGKHHNPVTGSGGMLIGRAVSYTHLDVYKRQIYCHVKSPPAPFFKGGR